MSEPIASPEIVDVRDALSDLRALDAGSVITGFEAVVQVDSLVEEVARLVHPTRTYRPPSQPDIDRMLKFKSTNDRSLQLVGARKGVRPMSFRVLPKTFTGTIVDIQVLALEDGLAVEDSGVASMVLAGCYKSSGKPKEPRFFTAFTVHSVVNEWNRTTHTGLKSRNYGNRLSPQDTMDAILEQSEITAHAVVANGLQNIFAGGLPGTGKKA